MATRGHRTTPPHEAAVRAEIPSPPPTRNSFAALGTASPTPSENSDNIQGVATICQGDSSDENRTLFLDEHRNLCPSRPDGFLATFLETWPEDQVTDATSRRIWDSFRQSHSDADAIYSSLDYRHQDLTRANATFWSTTNARLDESERAVKSTLDSISARFQSSAETLLALEQMSGVIESSVSELAAISTRQEYSLKSIFARLEDQSNILRTITQRNESRDARVLTVEENLVTVNESVTSVDAKLRAVDAKLVGFRATSETTTSTLRLDVNDLRARIIPDLRRDLLTEIQASARATAQVIDSTVHEALARLPVESTLRSSAATADAAVPADSAGTAHATTAKTGVPLADDMPDSAGTAHATPAKTGVPLADDMRTTDPGTNSASVSASDGSDNRGYGISDTQRVGFHQFRSPPRWTSDVPYKDDTRHVTPGDDRASRLHHDVRSRSDVFRPPPLDTEDIPKGGPIRSPRASDRERLARSLKTSRFDLAALAHSDYHGGSDGVSALTIGFIHECGYDSISVEASEDVLLCYNDIILVHRKVVAGWTNYRTGRSGPTVEYIIEKALVNFPKLRNQDARAAVDFYDKLQKLSAGYLLPLMPFDAIKLSFNFEGLCPPGIGTHRYAEVGSALMDILPRLLPTTESEITSAIATVGFESNNGYDLLWRVLELTVPGFDPTVPILPPTWHRDSDVFDFCHAHLLYFRLQAKKNNYFDARTRTSIFLRAIADSEYADIVTLLQAQVNSFRHIDGDDGYLPHHLRLSGIATLINTNAKARVRDFASPRVNRALGSGSDWDMAFGSTYDWDAVDDEELPFCHVQGYTPRVHRLDQGRDRADRDGHRDRDRDRGPTRSRREHDQRRDFGSRDRGTPRPGARGPFGGRNGDATQGRSLRPDQRRRPFLPGVICAACKRTGHEATRCDMLAIALFVDRHKERLSETEKSDIEATWLARWKDKVGQPTRTPRQVMRAYCEELDISADHLVAAMDWDCWPTSSDAGDVAEE
jgi:hypothetical protein